MKVKFEIFPHTLRFRLEAGTSRGSFTEKETWFIKAYNINDYSVFGIGEASPLKGLSIDYSLDYELKLLGVLDSLEGLEFPEEQLGLLDFIKVNTSVEMPSLRFGIEIALLDLLSGGKKKIFDSPFSRGEASIPINGLIWMGDINFMQDQIDEKLKKGFDCIKIKIGAIDFEQEVRLLEKIREQYTSDEVVLRVDANGAFNKENALERLNVLAALDIHSIEQPIAPGQTEFMRQLCTASLLPIALDEELIGITTNTERENLLKEIRPAYIILKPSLLGGVTACREWINIAESLNIGWWMTSMLESNVGLNAIAQLASTYENLMHQGLGTGQLYTNNINSPLTIKKGCLKYNIKGKWEIRV